jgi:hypothetical protein
MANRTTTLHQRVPRAKGLISSGLPLTQAGFSVAFFASFTPLARFAARKQYPLKLEAAFLNSAHGPMHGRWPGVAASGPRAHSRVPRVHKRWSRLPQAPAGLKTWILYSYFKRVIDHRFFWLDLKAVLESSEVVFWNRTWSSALKMVVSGWEKGLLGSLATPSTFSLAYVAGLCTLIVSDKVWPLAALTCTSWKTY